MIQQLKTMFLLLVEKFFHFIKVGQLGIHPQILHILRTHLPLRPDYNL